MSFRYKFLLTFILIEALFVAVIVMFNFSAINSTSKMLIKEQLESSSSLFSEVVKAPLLVNDLATVDDAASNFASLNNIVMVVVLNNNHLVISEATQQSIIEQGFVGFERLNQHLMTKSLVSESRMTVDGQDYIFYRKPIELDKKYLGELRFIYDASPVLHVITYNKQLTLLILGLELLLGTTLAIFLGYRITQALTRLALIADNISHDDAVDFSTLPSRKDEIGVLSKAMQEMQQKIQERTLSLKKAEQEALQASEAKSEFMAVMSHEIRTPLNGILGSLNLIEHSNLSQEDTRYLKVIRSSSEQLLGVINDVLDFSKIQAGKFDLDVHVLDVEEMLSALKVVYEPLVEAKGLTFKFEVHLPQRYMDGDEFRIKQILNNYLNNALKFTEQGFISLEAAVREDGALVFTVVDSGIGIKGENLSALFRDFSQVHRGANRQFGGTGLGLVICKRLAEMMAGSVDVQSEFGQGSRFSVILHPQWRQQQDYLEEQKHLKVPNAELHGLNAAILLVEDNAVNQLVAQKLLDKMGCEVQVANHGEEALEMVTSGSFDLILMDCQMPVMDGFEAAKRIRAMGLKTPIVALTANIQPADRLACLAAGMDGFLSKPFKPQELYDIVRTYVPDSSPMS